MRYETVYEVHFSVRYSRPMMFKLVYAVERAEDKPYVWKWSKVYEEEVSEATGGLQAAA